MSRYFSARGNVSRDSTSSSRSRVLVSDGKASASRSTGSPCDGAVFPSEGGRRISNQSVWTSLPSCDQRVWKEPSLSTRR